MQLLHSLREAANYQKGKKKRNPKVALKIPPKEEVLEECVTAAWKTATRLHYRQTIGEMQAFAAALQHNVDARRTTSKKSICY
jgi:hypothetical protein